MHCEFGTVSSWWHLLLPPAGRRCFDRLSTGIRGSEENDPIALILASTGVMLACSSMKPILL